MDSTSFTISIDLSNGTPFSSNVPRVRANLDICIFHKRLPTTGSFNFLWSIFTDVFLSFLTLLYKKNIAKAAINIIQPYLMEYWLTPINTDVVNGREMPIPSKI